MVYASDRNGCLLNSRLTGDGDLYVSGRYFRPGVLLEVSVVPNQRSWYVNDSINDVSGVSTASAPERVTADANGRFTVKVWDKVNQQRGIYDIVAHDLTLPRTPVRRVGSRDIISYAAETGFIFYLIYPVGGPTMDIAGRPIGGSPYFEFADSFALASICVGRRRPTLFPLKSRRHYAAYYW